MKKENRIYDNYKDANMVELNTYADVKSSKVVVYIYEDNDNKVAYCGIDSNGDTKKRHRNHLTGGASGKISEAEIELMRSPSKYSYKVIAICSDIDEARDIEAALITIHKIYGGCYLNDKEELK